MMSATFALPIDERRVVGILDYVASDTGITPMAFWIKLKPTDSYLDRELRASEQADIQMFTTRRVLERFGRHTISR